jgi:hypothetical protein
MIRGAYGGPLPVRCVDRHKMRALRVIERPVTQAQPFNLSPTVRKCGPRVRAGGCAFVRATAAVNRQAQIPTIITFVIRITTISFPGDTVSLITVKWIARRQASESFGAT